ncbi:hypothetical protein [Chloroflexus aurantiacus]|nr:hypothetical protein [Chloroflexus aurantiacus]
MLPWLYALQFVPVIGYLTKMVPSTIYCRQCGHEIGDWQELDLVLDHVPEWDLVASSEEAYFISPRFLVRLADINASGYTYRPIKMSFSDDVHRFYPEMTDLPELAPQFHHLVITVRCDGPWMYATKGEPCALCSQPVPIPPKRINIERLTPDIAGETIQPPRHVFPNTWCSEDFFYLTEPGPLLITEGVAMMFAETGNV